MKKLLIVFLLMSVVLAMTVSCTIPHSEDPWENPPTNPDPNDPIDPNDTNYVDIGFTIYANFENQIRAFESNDPNNYTIIVTGINSLNPQFYVTDDESHIVFSRYGDYDADYDGISETGHYLFVKNISTGNEIILSKNSPSQLLLNEFIVSGNNVIYSNNGTMVNYNIDAGNYVSINGDSGSHVCNHFMTLFSNGLMTFVEQYPGSHIGNIHVLPYDGTSQVPLFGFFPGPFDFGNLLYPTLLNGNGLMYMSETDNCNTFIMFSDYISSSTPTSVRIYCSDTSDVSFKKVYQTPKGSTNILYGYNSIYWFGNDGSIGSGGYSVSGKTFTRQILNVVSTPNESYYVIHDRNGVWVYNNHFVRVNCEFNWMNQIDEIFWIDVK